MLEIKKMISPYNFSKGNDIKYIVVHYTGNKGDNAENNAIYFNGGNRNASAHYFVSDDQIYQVVEDFNSAWSVGDGGGEYGITNYNSLNIEMCCYIDGEVSEQTESNTIELVKYIMEKYNINIDHVVRHYDASRKNCPNWSQVRWDKFKNKLDYQEEEEEVAIKDVFAENYYLDNNPDVRAEVQTGKLTAKDHYLIYGKSEGRKPNCGIPEGWNEAGYLMNNPDVNANISSGEGYRNGLEHYLLNGYREGRTWEYKHTCKIQEQDKNLGEKFYRVCTGSFKQIENARTEKEALKNKGIDNAFVVEYYKN